MFVSPTDRPDEIRTAEKHDAGARRADVPTIPEMLFILLLTAGFVFFSLGSVFAVSYFFPLDNEILLLGVVIVVPAAAYGRVKGYSFRRLFRLHAVRWDHLAVTAVIGLSLIIMINFMENWLESLQNPEWYISWKSSFDTDLAESLAVDSLYSFAVIVLGVVVFAAVCEEMLFRGFIQQSLERRFSAGSAVLVTALIFTSLHPFSLLPIFILAVVLGFVSLRSNSIIPGVIIHGLNNSLSLYALNAPGVMRARTSPGIEVSVSLFILSLTVFAVSIWYYLKISHDQGGS